MTMDYKQFQEWLSGIDQLSPAFLGASDTSASLAAVKASEAEIFSVSRATVFRTLQRGQRA